VITYRTLDDETFVYRGIPAADRTLAAVEPLKEAA
jgi:hypothetical protein